MLTGSAALERHRQPEHPFGRRRAPQPAVAEAQVGGRWQPPVTVAVIRPQLIGRGQHLHGRVADLRPDRARLPDGRGEPRGAVLAQKLRHRLVEPTAGRTVEELAIVVAGGANVAPAFMSGRSVSGSAPSPTPFALKNAGANATGNDAEARAARES